MLDELFGGLLIHRCQYLPLLEQILYFAVFDKSFDLLVESVMIGFEVVQVLHFLEGVVDGCFECILQVQYATLEHLDLLP